MLLDGMKLASIETKTAEQHIGWLLQRNKCYKAKNHETKHNQFLAIKNKKKIISSHIAFRQIYYHCHLFLFEREMIIIIIIA